MGGGGLDRGLLFIELGVCHELNIVEGAFIKQEAFIWEGLSVGSFSVCPVNNCFFFLWSKARFKSDSSTLPCAEHALNHPTLGSVRMFEELNRPFLLQCMSTCYSLFCFPSPFSRNYTMTTVWTFKQFSCRQFIFKISYTIRCMYLHVTWSNINRCIVMIFVSLMNRNERR